MTEQRYVQEVLSAYLSLPHTARRAGPADRRLARSLFSDNVPIDVVLSALLLGSLRRLVSRAANAAPLPTVRSLAYFLPIIEELRPAPLDPSYHAYLKQAFLRAASTIGQKSAVSSGR
jgi:hypothetical protein